MTKIIIPTVTPFNNRKIDERGIEKLIKRSYKYADVFFCLGFTGEFNYLNLEEKEKVILTYKNTIEREAEKSGRHVPLIAGISSRAAEETYKLVNFLEKNKIETSVIIPYFCSKDKGMKLVKQISNYNKVMLYNNPSITGKNLLEEDFEELAQLKGVIGMKDSSGDLERFKRYLEIAKKYNKNIFQGSENLIADSLLLGAQGFVPAMANVFPEIFEKLRISYEDENFARTKRYQDEISYIRDTYIGAVIPILKKTLALEGICTEKFRIKTKLSKKEIDARAKGMKFTYYILRNEWP